jgi:hypothetical protein
MLAMNKGFENMTGELQCRRFLPDPMKRLIHKLALRKTRNVQNIFGRASFVSLEI